MERKTLTSGLSVGPQIGIIDVAELAKAGFRSIICNRPDGEGADQPGHAELASAAQTAGLALVYLPVTPGAVTDASVEAFDRALSALSGPVFAFCRTGTRSTTLWSLAEAKRRPLPEILRTAKAAGYDMDGLADRIADRANS